MITSIAQSIFNDLAANDETSAVAKIESLISSDQKTFEDQHLELKGGRVQKPGEIWSRALSAFANTGGGTIIWGIKTAKDSSGVDCASELDMVSDPLRLQGELEKCTQHATDPLVSGVQIKAFPTTGEPGFVICYVPESNYKPHRAMQASGQPYLGRFNHRTDVIPTPFLRNLFYPEKNLRLKARLDLIATEGDGKSWTVRCILENCGSVTGLNLFAKIATNRVCEVRANYRWKLMHKYNIARTTEPGPDGYNYTKERTYIHEMVTNDPLHPGNQVILFEGGSVLGIATDGIEIQVTLFSHDQLPRTGILRIDSDIQQQVIAGTKHRETYTIHFEPIELSPMIGESGA